MVSYSRISMAVDGTVASMNIHKIKRKIAKC